MFNSGHFFIFQKEFSNLVAILWYGSYKNTKFQLNISKIMPARPKETKSMGCEIALPV